MVSCLCYDQSQNVSGIEDHAIVVIPFVIHALDSKVIVKQMQRLQHGHLNLPELYGEMHCWSGDKFS